MSFPGAAEVDGEPGSHDNSEVAMTLFSHVEVFAPGNNSVVRWVLVFVVWCELNWLMRVWSVRSGRVVGVVKHEAEICETFFCVATITSLGWVAFVSVFFGRAPWQITSAPLPV